MKIQTLPGSSDIYTYGFPRSPLQIVLVNGSKLPKNKQKAILTATKTNFLSDGMDRVQFGTDSEGNPLLMSGDPVIRGYGVKPSPYKSVFHSLLKKSDASSPISLQVSYKNLTVGEGTSYAIDDLFDILSDKYLAHMTELFAGKLREIGFDISTENIEFPKGFEVLKDQPKDNSGLANKIHVARTDDLQEEDNGSITVVPDKNQRKKLLDKIEVLLADRNRILDYGFTEKSDDLSISKGKEYYLKVKDDAGNIYTIRKDSYGPGNNICDIEIELTGYLLPNLLHIPGLEGLSELFDLQFINKSLPTLEHERNIWAFQTVSQNLQAMDPTGKTQMSEDELKDLFLDKK